MNAARLGKNELYKDRDWLIDQYHNQKKSQSEIATEFNIDQTTVLYWFRKYAIAARTKKECSTLPAAINRARMNIAGRRGPANGNWKGGRHKRPDGYVLVKGEGHPHADSNGYVFEHRLVAELMLGRMLSEQEVVHHINGKRDDNSRDNLMVFPSNEEHLAYHRNHNLEGAHE